jgi:asparagine N-glycosylation enzyme membrane subunit Stt3
LNKKNLSVLLLVAVAVASVIIYTNYLNKDTRDLHDESDLEDVTPDNVEYIGGKYDASIKYFENYSRILYTDETGQHDGYFEDKMRDTLDWIKNSAPEESVFFSWWDYGHMIKGYGEKSVVVRNPSKDILESLVNPDIEDEFDSNETILDVANALSATDETEFFQIIEEYSVSHILVTELEPLKSAWIFHYAGLDYQEFAYRNEEWTESAKQTMIAKLVDDRDIELEIVYEDEYAKIYSRTQ